jgi:hypothetical protein
MQEPVISKSWVRPGPSPLTRTPPPRQRPQTTRRRFWLSGHGRALLERPEKKLWYVPDVFP